MSTCQQKCEDFCNDLPGIETTAVIPVETVDDTLQVEENTYNKLEKRDGLNLECPSSETLAQGKTMKRLCDEKSDCIGYTTDLEGNDMCLIQSGKISESDERHFYEKETDKEEEFPTTTLVDAYFMNLQTNFTDKCAEEFQSQKTLCNVDAQKALTTCKPCIDAWWESSELNGEAPDAACKINTGVGKYSLIRNMKYDNGVRVYTEFPITCDAFLSPQIQYKQMM